MGKIIFFLLSFCPVVAFSTILINDDGIDAEQRWLFGSLPQEKQQSYSFQTVIPKGAVLENLETHEKSVLPESVIAWVIIPVDASDQAFILEAKDKKPLYKTSSQTISPASEITDLGPNPKSYETYKGSDSWTLDDKSWKLTMALNAHIESGDPALYADATGIDVQSATAVRCEVATLFGKRTSLNFGPSFSYRTGVFIFSDTELPKGRFESYNLGLVIDFPLYIGDIIALKMRLSGISSPVYRIREYAGERNTIDFSNRELQGAMEIAYQWFGPDLVFGLFLQKQWTVLETHNRPAGPSATPMSPVTTGVYLGLKTTFDL